MTTLINLYGGPGTGKSTTAAKLFAYLKDQDMNCELVTEYVKQWAWENRVPVNYDQFYLFGKQARREYTLFNKVDYIITDSPVELSGYYAHLYGTPEQDELFKQMINVYRQMCNSHNVDVKNIFLKTTKPYNPKGRFQTELEAKAVDLDMIEYLKSLNVSFSTYEANNEGISQLIKELK
jgi:AAA domain